MAATDKEILTNRQAFHEYHILDKFEAGAVLVGTEVKSIMEGRIQLKDSYVQVKDGEVTLSGTVDDRDQKRRAEDVAESVSGVNDVTNNIRVSRDRNRGRGTTQAASAMGRGKSSAG